MDSWKVQNSLFKLNKKNYVYFVKIEFNMKIRKILFFFRSSTLKKIYKYYIHD